MIKANNIVPSIAGIGVLVAGVTLIKKHNAKKMTKFKRTLERNSINPSSNTSFVEFSEQSYTKLAEFEDKNHYMNLDELAVRRHYIELGVVKKKTS